MCDDDWDAPPASNSRPAQSYSRGVHNDENGSSFSRGRGYKPAARTNNAQNNDDWGNNNNGHNAVSYNTYDDAFDASQQVTGNKPRRDYGGGDRNGDGNNRQFNRGRFRNGDDNNDGDRRRHNGDGGGYDGGERKRFNDNHRDGERRGGGGGGFNKDRNKTDDNNGGEQQEERKKVVYVPPERQNEEDLFEDGISCGINFQKLSEIAVNVSGANPPKPIESFEASGLRAHLLGNVSRSGYKVPTPVQKYSIPVIMNGSDLMGCAQTGSGKTAAFLLPMINALMAQGDPAVVDDNCCKPNAVIVSPTRELTVQIHEQALKFSHNSIIKAHVAYGGVAVSHQRGRLMSGCHILVATPGRLNDFVKRSYVSFECVKYFVLDEADRMLDMGFLPTVEEFLNHSSMPATGERQTLMFSATFPEEIQELARRFLHNYIFLTVGIVGGACTDVEQTFVQVTKFDKRNKLMKLIEECPNERTLVFVETKRTADFIATFLSENNISSTSIHGDRMQNEREEALNDFKLGRRFVLVATGVAARGLDIKGVAHVINYDLPKSIDEYVHRIGRTGRVGNRGKATSFFDDSHDRSIADNLARILNQANQVVPEWMGSNSQFYGRGDANTFGGQDIRDDDWGGTGGASNSAITAQAEDDGW